jgi:hypothetical protein
MKDWYEEFKHMDSFGTVGEYLSTVKVDYSKVYGPEYLVIHVASMEVRKTKNYDKLKLLVSEEDAGAIFSNKITLEEFCSGTKDSEVRMFKLSQGVRNGLDALKVCKKISE